MIERTNLVAVAGTRPGAWQSALPIIDPAEQA
jgi:hypothetical protein